MKSKLFLLPILIILFSFSDVSAGHMAGGEITYRSVGAKKYEITFRIYRDCQSIPLNSPAIMLWDYGGNTSLALNYTRTSIDDVNIMCPDITSKICSPANQTVTKEGVEMHTFKSTIDFSVTPYKQFVDKGVCQIGVSIEQYSRIDNLTTMSTENFFIDAMIDICESRYNNSSPKFPAYNSFIGYCNQLYAQNMGGADYVDYDSLKFELVTPLIARGSNNSYLNSFSSQYPMTPYCPPNPGVINCKPLPNAIPPRGFSFNPLNGDIVFYPSQCGEIGYICVKISEYRKDSAGNWKMLGFVKRDFGIKIESIATKNYLHTNDMDYPQKFKFRTREKHCENVVTFDTTVTGFASNNRGDVTSISMLGAPPGMTLSYKDSGANKKTGIICWTVPDSIYFKTQTKHLPVTIEFRDNFCSSPYVMRRTFHTYIDPPDSLGRVTVNTYDDKNGDQALDNGDTLMPMLVKRKNAKSHVNVVTGGKGTLNDTNSLGSCTYGIPPHPYLLNRGKDTTLTVKFDSNHIVSLIAQRTPGIYGRIFRDANSNCKYDAGEKTLEGYKVFTDSNKYTGISDKNGIYFIKAPKGTYLLKCEDLPVKYTVNCPGSKSISVTINGTSSYANNDFGVIPSGTYKDLSVGIRMENLVLDNSSGSYIVFYCRNNGTEIRRNIQLKVPLPENISLLQLSYALYAAKGTTAYIQIDSILPGKTFSLRLFTGASSSYFKANDKVTFTCMLDSLSSLSDDVRNNNSAIEYRIINGFYKTNQKNVSKDSIFTPLDKEISYTINYQNNVTNAVVPRLIITDTLDKKYHDISKFSLNWSDHPCEVIISDNVVTFIFDNINLPPASTRFGLNFTVGLKSDIASDVDFRNRATVFFDETPVLTPQADMRIISPVSITKLLKANICRNEKNKAFYNSNVKLESGNNIVVELSDNAGSFSSPVVLNTVNTVKMNDSIEFIFPKSLAAGTYKIRLRSTSPASTGMPSSGIFSVTAAFPPSFTVGTNLNNNGLCDMDTLKITCNNQSYFYKILKNNVSLDNFSTNNVYKIALTTNDKIKVVAMENSTTCKDTLLINPVIYPKPSISIKSKYGKIEFCRNDVIILQGTGGQKYQFLRNDTALGIKSASDTVAATALFTSEYKVIGESGDGCLDTSPFIGIMVNPLPKAFTVTAVPKNVCTGDSFTLNYSEPAYLYETFRNDTVIKSRSGITAFRTAAFSASDMFSVTGTNAKGCMVRNITPNLNVKPRPAKPVITVLNNGLSVNPPGISTYKWYKDGTLLPIDGNTIGNAPSGKYYIIVTNSGGCSNRSDEISFFNTGFDNILTASPFRVYPNPVSDLLGIYSENELTFDVRIVDLSGRLVYAAEDNHAAVDIDVSSLEAGVYFVSIFSEATGVETAKIIIRR
jgi:hypothetical protein